MSTNTMTTSPRMLETQSEGHTKKQLDIINVCHAPEPAAQIGICMSRRVPAECGQDVADLIDQCCMANPAGRPTAHDLIYFLAQHLGSRLQQELEVTYPPDLESSSVLLSHLRSFPHDSSLGTARAADTCGSSQGSVVSPLDGSLHRVLQKLQEHQQEVASWYPDSGSYGSSTQMQQPASRQRPSHASSRSQGGSCYSSSLE
jgi:hypothetical protein